MSKTKMPTGLAREREERLIDLVRIVIGLDPLYKRIPKRAVGGAISYPEELVGVGLSSESYKSSGGFIAHRR